MKKKKMYNHPRCQCIYLTAENSLMAISNIPVGGETDRYDASGKDFSTDSHAWDTDEWAE